MAHLMIEGNVQCSEPSAASEDEIELFVLKNIKLPFKPKRYRR